MQDIDKEKLIEFIKDGHPSAKAVFMDPASLVFEEAAKMNCFYCGKYNNNWRCPPNLPDIDYKKMVTEFDCGLFVSLTYKIHDPEDYASIRNESSITLHKLLLSTEKWMWEHNYSTAISFIGGSCKLCKSGCGKDRCNNPYMSRSPLEAIGVNVIKSAHKYGIDIVFPATQAMTRIGLLLWQEKEE